MHGCHSVALQRGRAPKSADTKRSSRLLSAGAALQRGRAPKSADTLRLSCGALRVHHASTRPRSEERGYGGSIYDRTRPLSASTRPRSEERGYASALSTSSTARLIASTRPRSEERGYSRMLKAFCRRLFASTRPRSEERGYFPGGPSAPSSRGFNEAALRRARIHGGPAIRPLRVIASTRPRSEERGYVPSFRCPSSSRGSFNEAALRRARIPTHVDEAPERPRCFNEAALRRARIRKGFCGGRGRCDASTRPRSEERGYLKSRHTSAPRMWLQRGRAPKSADTGVLWRIVRSAFRLQRGRAPKSADTSVAAGRCMTLSGFNEAALRRARIRQLGDSKGQRWPASTRPRSEERGYERSSNERRTGTSLQRGRAPKSADTFGGA